MSENKYAAKLMEAKRLERMKIYLMAQEDFLHIMTVALSDEFGFGRERLKRAEARFNALFVEYIEAQDGDLDYARKRLLERVAQIMREDGP